MDRLVARYAERLVRAGLAEPGTPLVAGLDAELCWNRRDRACFELEALMGRLSCNSLVCIEPAEPYRTIIAHLAGGGAEAVAPEDCETRTFLHDLPVVRSFDAQAMLAALRRRKGAIVADPDLGLRLVALGVVSPEQGFVTVSSMCFACFVLFFSSFLREARRGRADAAFRAAFAAAVAHLPPLRGQLPELAAGPLRDEDAVRRAMVEAGRATVEYGLVDSYFGNISFRLGDTLYISQTGSSLDDLAACIDPCPLNGSSCAAITASSELAAHMEIVASGEVRAILHGHPRFAVIRSLDCEREDCPDRGRCHIRCSTPRFVADIPIVPGEVGTGPFGLWRTLPPAIAGRRGAIVHGHGLFAVGRDDFNAAFATLLGVEKLCREEYFEQVARALG
jgi:ribulose-5-phosphate 4-epimerase/fuculose-1-phosphate aldolase